MKKVMIDTNIYTLAMKGDRETIDLLRKVDSIGISVICIGELTAGFQAGSRDDCDNRKLTR